MSRYRVAVPFIYIHTIGAGGGSIAWVDEGGALRVGPQSSGARPGPACYGFGGENPTVTDADLVLGYIDPASFLGGEMKLDLARAEQAVAKRVAEPLGMSVTEAAAGVFRIVNNGMGNSVRQVSLSKGYDPRDFALTAFGGAGAIHAGSLVEDLGIRTILVPKGTAPVLCALGDLLSDLRVSRVRSFYGRGSELDLSSLRALCEEMKRVAAQQLARQESHLIETRAHFSLEMRYLGQTHEVSVPLTQNLDSIEGGLDRAFQSFHALHEQLYTFNKPEDEVEILSVHLDLVGVRRKPTLPSLALEGADPSAAQRGERPVYSFAAGNYVDTPIYDGEGVKPGNRIEGPAVIEEARTSIVLFEGQSATLDAYLNYVVEIAR
jgi:N-methylhydantoinase A